jgi:hypothetical protein
MSGRAFEEIARFTARIDGADVARFARALGYAGTPGPFAPPTYPITLLATPPVADHLRGRASEHGGMLIHLSQTFDYARRPRIGEELQCRVLASMGDDGKRPEAVVVLELQDRDGADIGRAEARFAFMRQAGR